MGCWAFVRLIWWFGGKTKQTGMAFVPWGGGSTATISHTHTNTPPHAHKQYANYIACGVSDAPGAFPVHLWWQNDHSAPYNLSRAKQRHTHARPPHQKLDTNPPLPRRKTAWILLVYLTLFQLAKQTHLVAVGSDTHLAQNTNIFVNRWCGNINCKNTKS